MVARLLLLEVDDPLSALQRADIALVDGRVVAELLRRITADQKDVACNILVLIARQIEVGNGTDFRFGQIDILDIGGQHAEFAAFDHAVVVQTLFACSPHDDLQLLDVAADGVDRIIFRREPRHEIVVEFQIDIAEIESLPLRLAELVELNDEPLIVLDRR